MSDHVLIYCATPPTDALNTLGLLQSPFSRRLVSTRCPPGQAGRGRPPLGPLAKDARRCGDAARHRPPAADAHG